MSVSISEFSDFAPKSGFVFGFGIRIFRSKFGKSARLLGACCASIGQSCTTHAIDCERRGSGSLVGKSKSVTLRIRNPKRPAPGATVSRTAGRETIAPASRPSRCTALNSKKGRRCTWRALEGGSWPQRGRGRGSRPSAASAPCRGGGRRGLHVL
jgi:hypothetical protein